MTGFPELRTLERWMIYIRSLGIAYGAVAVMIQPSYPDAATEQAAWALVGLLAVGNVALWTALARAGDDRLHRLGIASFGLDVFVVCGIVWIFAFEIPYVTWALLFLLPMEGALRYRLRGALGAAAIVTAFFAAQTIHVADVRSEVLDEPTFVFVTGLAVIIAAFAGTMAENWHRQSLAFRAQSVELAEVDRLKNRFLAVTTHEIRGPLTAIIAAADAILSKPENLSTEQRDRLLEVTLSQAHQLRRLVDDLLLTAQIQGGKPSLHPEWVELEEALQGALDAASIKRRAHQLEVFIEPLQCEIDPARTAQIVRNLVENAYKYTPERTRVAVTARAVSGGISIEVADDGSGIPPERRHRLFEAFSRVEETTAGKDGLGLGLFVVGQLVTAMGGRIDLTSSSNGTTFTVMIPCRTQLAGPARLGLLPRRGQVS